MNIDKKCLKCPVRKFALQSAYILRSIYELNEDILDALDNFETGINEIRYKCSEQLKEVRK